MTRTLLLFLMLSVVAPLGAVEKVEPYRTEYTVHYNGFKVGEMKQRLKKGSGDNYVMETEVFTTGLVSWFKKDHIVERSTFTYHDGTLRPLSYLYRYTGREKDVVERLDFDWKKMQIKSLRNGKVKYLPLTPGVYDKQLYQLVMRRELGTGKKQFNYSIAERGKFEEYELEVVGQEKVMTTFGEVNAIVVKKGTTKLWLAKEYNYLVVKIAQNEDDNEATSYITSRS